MKDLFGNDVGTTEVIRAAVLSECGRYRYRLSRTWDAGLRPACFVMLNPSTADGTDDDATIRRCMGFARSWGCGGIEVVNLFAQRATDPKVLKSSVDPLGRDNDRHIRDAALAGHPVVAAWGAIPAWRERQKHVLRLLAHAGREDVMCLGVTKDKFPRHPLYVRADQPLIRFPHESPSEEDERP